jgi:hypothetical protein
MIQMDRSSSLLLAYLIIAALMAGGLMALIGNRLVALVALVVCCLGVVASFTLALGVILAAY